MSHNLVIEVDGSVHDTRDRIEIDAAREEYLRGRGLYVLRFRNEDVLLHLDCVMQRIKEVLAQR